MVVQDDLNYGPLSGRNQRGSLLLEIVIVLNILGMIAIAILGATQSSFIAKRTFEVQSMAENIIRNQMEYVFEQPYVFPPGRYLALIPPEGYSVAAEALVYDPASTNIETLRITVYKHGQAVKAFATIRTNR